ncbi:hypothetical protein HYH02_010924 [Chlamydomonas schloesseri]|uniref:MYND-type domain-containing protein n=1 Tax=Chlamydomonas schloesseri TaxID=2026947 RepID=A0A835W5M5_9CHLO|nr:hypothetical protein HYH02_010924 [Chlamydomonas schloesseri]|eukprot:KAG2438223.1 hypothetical protein HYH02_010924 [Chlamydomonas schloesseri]
MAAASSDGHRFLELRPVTEGDGWDAEALLKAISSATPLPRGEDPALEKAELRRRGWRDPRGLLAYSKDGPYKDLYIYFDAADRSSPVNVAASKAFRCYGLDGKQGVIDWEAIRGPCVLLRGEPPKMTSFTTGKMETMDFPYHPLITPQELVDTLLFFKGRDAHKVALKRDAARAMRDVPRNHPMWGAAGPNPGGVGFYMSPAGSRPADKVVGKDALACATCGKPNSIACGLKKCSACKSAWYCGLDCQRQDFPRHKKECKALAAAAAATEKETKEKAAKQEAEEEDAALRAEARAMGTAIGTAAAEAMRAEAEAAGLSPREMFGPALLQALAAMREMGL